MAQLAGSATSRPKWLSPGHLSSHLKRYSCVSGHCVARGKSAAWHWFHCSIKSLNSCLRFSFPFAWKVVRVACILFLIPPQLYKHVARNCRTFHVPGKEDCKSALPRRLKLPGNEICKQWVNIKFMQFQEGANYFCILCISLRLHKTSPKLAISWDCLCY